MAVASCSFSPAIYSLSSSSPTKIEAYQPILHPKNPNSIKLSATVFKKNNPFRFSRVRISHRTQVTPTYAFRVTAASDLGNGNSEAYPELGPPSSSSSSSPCVDSLSNDFLAEATAIDLKLPRRSLMIQFTCDVCGERTQRLINRLAYERGTVFVQCAGCLQHHKLVDNLGLVVEYDLREDVSTDSNTDQI